jgi:hypothetical protein
MEAATQARAEARMGALLTLTRDVRGTLRTQRQDVQRLQAHLAPTRHLLADIMLVCPSATLVDLRLLTYLFSNKMT